LSIAIHISKKTYATFSRGRDAAVGRAVHVDQDVEVIGITFGYRKGGACDFAVQAIAIQRRVTCDVEQVVVGVRDERTRYKVLTGARSEPLQNGDLLGWE